jgi:hypothetical protein
MSLSNDDQGRSFATFLTGNRIISLPYAANGNEQGNNSLESNWSIER